MEESKELQGFYKIFRSVIYVSILLEFFEYAIDLTIGAAYSATYTGVSSGG
jgi:hypothetical protein